VSKMANPRDILIKPVISEKSYRLADDGKYTFIVAPGANKTQIRQAVQVVFGVRVTGVPAATTQVLVVASVTDQATWLSLRKARNVHLLDEGQLNTYDVLVSDHVVFTQAALDSFVARSTGRGAADSVAADAKAAAQEAAQEEGQA